MSRPRKFRRVCGMPIAEFFGPMGAQSTLDCKIVLMSVDEYETIRLIDFTGCTQEECALQMDIARTTVQRIYNDARKKLADTLVNGKLLTIAGGDYRLCENFKDSCKCGCTNRCHKEIMEETNE
ncbi:MAG: DUF134 domain-containing protein [Anaerovorax sp.]